MEVFMIFKKYLQQSPHAQDTSSVDEIYESVYLTLHEKVNLAFSDKADGYIDLELGIAFEKTIQAVHHVDVDSIMRFTPTEDLMIQLGIPIEIRDIFKLTHEIPSLNFVIDKNLPNNIENLANEMVGIFLEIYDGFPRIVEN